MVEDVNMFFDNIYIINLLDGKNIITEEGDI